MDWRYVGQLQAVDRAGAGYGRPVPAIFHTVEALQGIPVLFGDLLTPYDTRIITPQTPMTKASLLRRSLDSTGGVLLYARMPMDGRTWTAIAETTRLVAEYEEVFLHGEPADVEGQDRASVQTVTHGDLTLACVMNHANGEGQWTVSLPAAAGAGREFYSGETVIAGETVTRVLKPGESAVYVLQR